MRDGDRTSDRAGEGAGDGGEGAGAPPVSEAAWDGADRDADGHGDGGGIDLDIPEAAAPSGLAILARRDLDDDAAYALRPDIALMREERRDADLGVEAALVLRALGRRP